MGRHSNKRGIMVYLPDRLHRRLKVKAALERESVSSLIERAALRAYPEVDGPAGATKVAEAIAALYSPDKPRPATKKRPLRRHRSP